MLRVCVSAVCKPACGLLGRDVLGLWAQYGLLIQMMAAAGYTVISTPFAVTFKHTDCAAAVHEVRLQQQPQSQLMHPGAHAAAVHSARWLMIRLGATVSLSAVALPSAWAKLTGLR